MGVAVSTESSLVSHHRVAIEKKNYSDQGKGMEMELWRDIFKVVARKGMIAEEIASSV